MLYIKFNIEDPLKYQDFQKLYAHMHAVRAPGFQFAEEEGPVIDWDDKQTDEEVAAAVAEISEFLDQKPEERRCKELLPKYVLSFFENYLKEDNEKLQALGVQDMLSLFNYLEFGFEVELDALTKIDENSGRVDFSTANYPFGGLERFIICLKAYGLSATECYDGFAVNQIVWSSAFEYKLIEVPEEVEESTSKKVLRMLIGIGSLFLSFGQTVMIKPTIATYIESELMLDLLQILCVIVGWALLYTFIIQNVFAKKKKG
ncbi:hypothetical protein GCM10011416_11890 [Polaribacter pacificus]|uniref:Uncharacterized protein n=1 Tax=Polaribacter pacificus TaxID=1775173 RepID=A0A917HYK2_9FLAO|nr:hypothetical protein [Polaribacter pacificus]GGG95840.1 hypothetical protein GCM10011416_11890 [Polaribacter pacificus]